MSGKIEISRELAERIERALSQVGVQDHLCDYTLVSDVKKELRALLAAPVVERQEPVGYFDLKELRRLKDIKGGYMSIIAYRDLGALVSPLYAEQPAPVAVVPTTEEFREAFVLSKYVDNEQAEDLAEIATKTCHDKVKELNQ